MNKKLVIVPILLLVIFCVSFAQDIPNPVGYVNDFAEVIDSNTEIKINSLIGNFEKATTNEIAVVTVKTVDGLDSKMYAVKLFEKWKIGKKEKDNGVLILLAMEERRVEIEVGYGLEGDLTDGMCGEILDKYIIPKFKQEMWGEGLLAGIEAVIRVLNKEENIVSDTTTSSRSASEKTMGIILTIVISCIVLFFIILAFYLSKPECPKCKKRRFVKRKKTRVIKKATYTSHGLKKVTYICRKCYNEWIKEQEIPQKQYSSSSNSSWGSGGGGSSGGGFGGGSSGGGGAGRSF